MGDISPAASSWDMQISEVFVAQVQSDLRNVIFIRSIKYGISLHYIIQRLHEFYRKNIT